MAFQLSNFVIDRVRRGVMLHSSTGAMLWSINQIENPSLSVTSETSEAVDALGTPIAIFNRGKNAEFSAENSLFDLGLLAAQSGTSIDMASAANKYTVPYFDEMKVTTADTLTLAYTPVKDSLKFVYRLNGDGTTGARYDIGTQTDDDTVTLSANKITFKTGTAIEGDRFLAFYDREANGDAGMGAAQVINTATNFPTAGRFVMEVLGSDVCDQSTVYAAIIELPNARMTSDFDISFTTDSKHPFTLRAMQDYCDPDKVLFRIVVPETKAMA